MRKSGLVIIGFLIAGVVIIGYAVYLLFNYMQVGEVIEEELAAHDLGKDLFTTTNGKSHEPQKDVEFSEGASETQES